jgi:hypothetical protein
MKNKYTFTIEVNPFGDGNSFMDKLLDEVNDEKNQLMLTQKINKESSKAHREILSDFVKDINKMIEPHGVSFHDEQISNTTNGYSDYSYVCKFSNGFTSAILITAFSDTSFKDSKYSTYTGEYQIRITRQRESFRRDYGTICSGVKNVLDALEYIRFDLKSHIENINH